jgi:hypothetical protein
MTGPLCDCQIVRDNEDVIKMQCTHPIDDIVFRLVIVMMPLEGNFIASGHLDELCCRFSAADIACHVWGRDVGDGAVARRRTDIPTSVLHVAQTLVDVVDEDVEDG